VPLVAQSYSILDGRVLGFAMLASIVTALFFGVLPSLYAGRMQSVGNRSSSTRYSRLIRETFVAVQVMLTIVLLTASVSVRRAFINLTRIDRGFDVRALVTVSVSLEGTTHQDGKRPLAYFEDALARIAGSGVRSASATEFLPLYATGFVGDLGDWTDVRPNGIPCGSRCCPTISRHWAEVFCTGANSRTRKCVPALRLPW